MVSPADGVVSDITHIDSDPLLGGPPSASAFSSPSSMCTSIAAPAMAACCPVDYKKGRFINAMRHDEASDENESNTDRSRGADNRPAGRGGASQIVGLIARRIICTAQTRVNCCSAGSASA